MALFSLLLSTWLAHGAIFVKPDPNINTFAASTGQFAPAASATDMCIISGSSTKTIRVIGLQVATQQTSAGTNEIFIVKRSTAATGGSSFTATVVPLDSGKASATATVKYYGANPTVGTPVGNIFVKRAVAAASTGLLAPEFEVFYPGGQLLTPVVLRGTGQSLAVNFGGRAVPSGFSISCNFLFTEE